MRVLPKRICAWLVMTVLFSTAAWFATGFLSADMFLALGASFAGIDEESARPIVDRLFGALRIGLPIVPWLSLCLWIIARAIYINRSHLDRATVFLTVLVAASLLSLPYPVLAPIPGLDNSWQWLLNRLAFSNAFGRDTVFTYGPLGFLLYPQMPLVNVLIALAANLLYIFLWMFTLASLYRTALEYHAAAWLLLGTMFFSQPNMEWRWVALSVSLAVVPTMVQTIRARSGLFACAGLTLAIVTFMKFSSLVIVLSADVLCLATVCIRERRLVKAATPMLLSFIIVGTALAIGCFDDLSSFARWFAGSLAIASGYNKYMGAPKSWVELAIPFAALALVAAAVFFRARAFALKVALGFIFSPVLFCAVKYSIVRQGPCPLFYLLAIACAIVLCVQRQLCRRMVVMSIFLLLATYAFSLPRAIAGETFCHFPVGINPMGLFRTATLSQTLRRAAAESSARIAPYRLPEEWRRGIGTQSVMFLPHEYAAAMGEDSYSLVLLPVFQLYSAYLPFLDSACAARINGADAPSWIVSTIDTSWTGQFISYPATWDAVIANYDYFGRDGNRVLLRHRTQHSRLDSTPSIVQNFPSSVHAGEWVDCQTWATSRLMIDWPQSLLGKCCTFFFRNTPISISLRFADSTEITVPILPENLRHPFSLSQVATTPNEFVSVISGGDARHPVAVRFHADTPILYSAWIDLSRSTITR